MIDGTIVKGIGGFYYVRCEDEVYECRARGKFRKSEITPLAGDFVSIDVKNGKGSIEKIHERKNMLIRPPVANIDCLVVVASADEPEPNKALIDNFLILGKKSGIETVIVISKSDLKDQKALADVYRKIGYKVIFSSIKTGEGKDEISDLFLGKITALAGNSGVGKSSILNMVCQRLNLPTGDISKKLNRGRHTTRHTELIELGKNSYVLDTPGFSSFELPDIEASDLQSYYEEFKKYIPNCRFKGCAHINEPDCAVKNAVLKNEIDKDRYENYRAMYNELKNVKKW